jgi:hypothetical protein
VRLEIFYAPAVIDRVNARSADGSIQHHALALSTVKAARIRVAITASSVSLPIDPDPHSEWLVVERNVFFRVLIFS